MPSQGSEWTLDDLKPQAAGQWTLEDLKPPKASSSSLKSRVRPFQPQLPKRIEEEPLQRAFFGSTLEGLSAIPELGRIVGEKMSTAPMYGGVGSLLERGAGAVSGALRGKAEEIDPAAMRGQGGLPEDLARGLGSVAGAIPGMALGPIGASVQFGAQSGVPLYYDVKQSTGDEEAALWALLGGGALGQLERFGVEGLLGNAVKRWAKGEAGQALVKTMLQKALGIGAAGVGEAGTELAQQAGEDILYESLTGEDVDNIERLKRAVPPALILGTGLGGLVEMVDSAKARKEGKVQEPEAPDAEQGEPASGTRKTTPVETEAPLAPASDAARPQTAPVRTVADISAATAPGAPAASPTAQPTRPGEARSVTSDVQAAHEVTWKNAQQAYDDLSDTRSSGDEDLSDAVNEVASEAGYEKLDAIGGPALQEFLSRVDAAHERIVSESVEEETGGPDLPEPANLPESPDSSPKTTSIKNAAIERDLEEMGLPLPEKSERRGFVQLHAEAKAKLEKNADYGRDLIDDLEADPRAPSDTEDAVLTFEANRLKEARKKAEEDYIQNPTPTNKKRIDEARDEFYRASQVLDRAGTESGRSLNARKLMLAEDYSLAALERDLRIAKGGEKLTSKELARVKEQQKELEAVIEGHKERLTVVEAEKAQLAAENALLRLKKDVKRSERRTRRAADIEQAKKDLSDALNELGSSMSAGALGGNINLKALAKAAHAVIRIGGKTFAQFADDMVARFGEGIRPHLQGAWDAAQGEQRREMAKGLKGKDAPEALHRALQPIARDFIESGITELDPLVDAVHGVVQQTNPSMSREEVRNAFAGYGIFRPLTKGETAKKLRDLRGQGREQAKLEDLMARRAKQKTGFEREEPSPTRKRLAKQVKDQEKFLRLKPVDTAKAEAAQTKAVETRLQAKINELEQQIAVGERSRKPGKKTKTTPAIEKARAELKALKEDYEETFKAELEQEMETSRLKALKTRTSNQIKELERRIAEKDYSDTPKPKPIELDPEAISLKAKEARIKHKLEADKERARLEQRGPTQRAIDHARDILDLDRSIRSAGDLSAVRRQGGVLTSAHPILAAKQFGPMLKAAVNPKISEEIMQQIKARDGYALSEAAGLEYTDLDGKMTGMEEELRSTLSKKIPVVRQVINASNRAFATYLNLIRSVVFDALIAAHPGNPTLAEAKEIARFVNIATGRAQGKGASVARALEGVRVFWAPSLAVSRFQLAIEPFRLMAPGGKGLTYQVRKTIAKELLRYIAGQAVYYVVVGSLLSATADKEDKIKIETDWTSSDYGKIRVGDTRIDPLSGLQQVATLTGRVITGRLGKKKVEGGRGKALLKFGRSKLGPSVGKGMNALLENDPTGKKLTPKEALLQPPIPLSWEGVLDVAKDIGIPSTVITQTLSILGDGIQSYD